MRILLLEPCVPEEVALIAVSYTHLDVYKRQDILFRNDAADYCIYKFKLRSIVNWLKLNLNYTELS